uniref:Glycosyltransferase n=1 Tax=Acidobacterium capsulatum TaxID=33075 RepID=A0A7V4XUR9_9BACT
MDVTVPETNPHAASRPMPRPDPLLLAGVRIDRMPMSRTLDWIAAALEFRRQHPGKTRPLQIMGPNAHIVSAAQHEPALLDALAHADLCLPDGISVVLAGRALGCAIPERVTGGELMEQLCALAARLGYSVFFLGGLPGAATGAAEALTVRYPGLRIAGTFCPAPGFEQDPARAAQVIERVSAAAPDILCVALGVPKQEVWMHRNVPSLPIRLAISVGAALDTQAGLRHRAPAWTHRIGMEWAWRLTREPRRLGRRYLVGNTEFLLLAFHAWRRQRFSTLPGAQSRTGWASISR